MPDEPYRPAPPPDPARGELERLAAAGQQRIVQASAAKAATASTAAERNLRVALGGHYGAPVRWTSYGVIAAGVVLAVGDTWWPAGAFFPGLALAAAGVLVRIFAEPRASRARVEAERAWSASLPFRLDGYFEALAAVPSGQCWLRVVVAWAGAGAPPDASLVQGALGVVDTSARVTEAAAEGLTIETGPISGATGIRVNRVWVYRNTRVVAYVHDLVDRVLVPLHRTRAIARVALARA
jgi:hypothetical protein